MRYLVLIISLIFTSCSDFLKQDDKTRISREQLYSTISGFSEALGGAYYNIADTKYMGGDFIVSSELMGGNAKFIDINDNSVNQFRDTYEFEQSVEEENDVKENIYQQIYKVINISNTIIEEINVFEEGTQEQRNQILGEALAIRAMCHFDLCRIYAQPYSYSQNAQHLGVVYLKNTISYSDSPSRSKLFECYNNIIEDLTRAKDLVNTPIVAKYSNIKAYFSKLSIEALLARVYLYKNDWDNAIKSSTNVIQGGYSLVKSDELYQIWNVNTPSEEDILILDKSGTANKSLAIRLGYTSSDVADFGVSNDLISKYSTSDVRRNFYIYTNGKYITSKYSVYSDRDHYVSLFRLAEMYLIRAEANMKTAIPNEVQARADLDVIRKRANTNAENINLSGQALLDEIFNERRRELAMEGHLFFDIKRQGKDVVRDDCTATENKNLEYPNYRFVMPIPKDAVEYNTNMVQNEGY